MEDDVTAGGAHVVQICTLSPDFKHSANYYGGNPANTDAKQLPVTEHFTMKFDSSHGKIFTKDEAWRPTSAAAVR